ncbi:MAG: hypothetical protein ACR2MN_01750 [Acidimicrobiales bacterium]
MSLIGRMIERATTADAVAERAGPAAAGAARFARDVSHFATKKPNQDNGSSSSEVASDGAA